MYLIDIPNANLLIFVVIWLIKKETHEFISLTGLSLILFYSLKDYLLS
ncbi:hypothetical protein J2Y60_003860 [Arcicella sp. BE140]|nr:hypothetical protein [Arcicella sp. BE51]MDR6813648.1 hypothetical protein [Arcicella sp. BE140]MDR6824971.1 hypothetical protein [Arcicella sp. BE139]